ncbi:uncharacterized protein PAC_19134 [Phialocephala subalpina]|uniref:Uncharacterized protein n=1 Tax=Phialocephala subalpina TaxID=576137 RepID=A0A1L7XW17_9HELO|nr:uncharacterized protein PAC_19134 [Phialocephala subalpina]
MPYFTVNHALANYPPVVKAYQALPVSDSKISVNVSVNAKEKSKFDEGFHAFVCPPHQNQNGKTKRDQKPPKDFRNSVLYPLSCRSFSPLHSEPKGTLQNLEILVASRSFQSTMIAINKLEAWVGLPVLLKLLWILSPLGGQASLRVLSPQQITDHSVEIP